jgi:hypothetical protein
MVIFVSLVPITCSFPFLLPFFFDASIRAIIDVYKNIDYNIGSILLRKVIFNASVQCFR